MSVRTRGWRTRQGRAWVGWGVARSWGWRGPYARVTLAPSPDRKQVRSPGPVGGVREARGMCCVVAQRRSGRRRGKRLAAVRGREWFRLVEVFRDFKTQGMGQNCAKTRKLLFGLFLCPSVDCEAPPPVLPAAGTRITCTASGARPRLRTRVYYCVREPKPRLLTRGPRWGRAVTELNAAAVL